LAALREAELIIGHNIVRFDVPFLEAQAHLYGLEELLPPRAKYYDTAAVYKGMMTKSEQRPDEPHWDYAEMVLATRVFGLKYNVAACCQELKIEAAGLIRHRALADVILTYEIYKKLNAPKQATLL
jgi:DNA polymerase III epsilon subunit-like protein